MPLRVNSQSSTTSYSSGEPLEFPRGTTLGQLYQTMNDFKPIGERIMRVTVNQPMTQIRDDLTDLEVQQRQALQKKMEAGDLYATWSHASYIASIIYAVVSMSGGAYLMFEGHPEGRQLIASGVLFLTQTVLSSGDQWKNVARTLSLGNSALEETLHSMLPTATLLTAFIWGGVNIAKLPVDHQKKMQVLESIFAFASGATKVGEAWTKYKKGHADAELQRVDSEMEQQERKLKQLLPRNSDVADSNRRIESGLRKTIKREVFASASAAHYLT